MIFMRALGVDQSVSSKSLPHRVGYWTHWTSTMDIANEIHYPVMIYLTRVATHKGLDKYLSILACLLLLSCWPHILALLPTINQVTPSHGCSVVKIWLRPAGLSGTTSSLMQFVFETKRNHPATIFSEYLQPVQGNYSMVKIISLSSAYIACRRHPYIKSIPTL